MRKYLLAAAAALTVVAAGTAAGAAQFITFTPPAADGSFTGAYGDTDLVSGAFTDTFTFNMPNGTAAGTLSSTFTSDPLNNVDFTTVTLNGHAFTIVSTGQTEFRDINNVLVTNGPQTLIVSGTSGGKGSFSGTLSFEGAGGVIGGGGGVPEPAGWALMILGIGGVGVNLRARRKAHLATA